MRGNLPDQSQQHCLPPLGDQHSTISDGIFENQQLLRIVCFKPCGILGADMMYCPDCPQLHCFFLSRIQQLVNCLARKGEGMEKQRNMPQKKSNKTIPYLQGLEQGEEWFERTVCNHFLCRVGPTTHNLKCNCEKVLTDSVDKNMLILNRLKLDYKVTYVPTAPLLNFPSCTSFQLGWLPIS